MNGKSTIRPGITDEFLAAAGVEVLSADSPYLLKIPYRDWQGNLTGHYRCRLRNVTADGQKYYQEPDSGAHVYFHHLPLCKCKVLYLTEGEFKALCLALAGYQAIGLPGLHCYVNDEDEDIPPILLPGILETIQQTACVYIYVVGDSDTLTNLEFYRSAGVLAQGIPFGVSVGLIQIPLGGPKGVDDLCAAMNDGEFPAWLSRAEVEAQLVDREKSFLVTATLVLETKAEAIHKLSPAQREHHVARLVRMAAYARMSKEDSLVVTRFCLAAQKASKMNRDDFDSAVEHQIGKLKDEGELQGVGEKTVYYDRIAPWPVERPLADTIAESREITHRFVVTDPRHVLLTSCWSPFTFAYQHAPYLPMLVFTGAEEDSGKSTYMKVVGRMSFRTFPLVSVTVIHRIAATYIGVLMLDECKRLGENIALIEFMNAGFNNSTDNPVDAPMLMRYDMEGRKLLEFSPRFPKMCAGIGQYLERDTLSRSLVIPLERYTMVESGQIKEYDFFCTDAVTLPIYRALLKFWTEERKKAFGKVCQEVMLDFPAGVISRQRQKFIPLLAVAKLAGSGLYEETCEAIKWFVETPDLTTQVLSHRLLCDIAQVFFRAVRLHQLGVSDPVSKLPSAVLHQPKTGTYLIPTPKLLELLRALPEAPWRCYGREKKILDANGLFEMLRPYRLGPAQLKIAGTGHRGLVFTDFCDRYVRYRRAGDPTVESVAEELRRDFDSGEGGSNVPPSPPSPAPEGGFNPSQKDSIPEESIPSQECVSPGGPEKGCDPGTFLDNLLNYKELEGHTPLEKKNTFLEGGVTFQEVVTEPLTEKGPRVTPGFSGWRGNIPLSIPAAGFCTASPTLGLLPIDIETCYPWPGQGDFPQPPGHTVDQLRRLQKRHKAHPYAKDSRRCALRFLTIQIKGTLYTHDFQADPELPEELRHALKHSTLLGHNLDFDVTVLRRHGIELSSAWIDTMLASRLLGLGKERGNHDAIEEELDLTEEAELCSDDAPPLDNPADNNYGAVVARYLGVKLDKSLGASDWSLPPTSEQMQYVENDVAYLGPLWAVLKAELHAAKLHDCFVERMEFAPRLNMIKMVGAPINRTLCEQDNARALAEREDCKKRLREAFSQLRFEIPPSRRKKVKKIAGTPAGAKLTVELDEREPLNPNKPEHVKAALASHGIMVPDAKKKTLARLDHPSARLFIAHSEAKALLTTIAGILHNVFADGRVRAGGWNQIAARTGRLHSTEPNLQNLPRRWRKAFEAPAGTRWLKSDLSQIEMVIIALHYKCEHLLELLAAPDKDVYTHIAARVFDRCPVRGEGEDQVTDLLRDVAKVLTLGISYVLGWRSFIKQVENRTGLVYTEEQAKEFYSTFWALYPEIKQAHEEARLNALEMEAVYTVTGQRRFLPPLLYDQDSETGYWPSRERRARILVNTPIQGSCANLYIRALNLIIPRLPPGGVEVVNLVHDEIDLIVPLGLERETKEVVTRGFEQAFKSLYGEQIAIRMEHRLGPSWAEGEKI